MKTITTINWHMIQACNMKCKFCFATFNDLKNGSIKRNEQFQLLETLWGAGLFKKINFAGGEPTLIPHLPDLIKYASDLGFETSIVTNGSLINENWLNKVVNHLNILTLSVDSFNNNTNLISGRNQNGKIMCKENILKLTKNVKDRNINLKINTVVSMYNKEEVLTDLINTIRPFRWKILQATKIIGQNEEIAQNYLINANEFNDFVKNNIYYLGNDIKAIIESSDAIIGSYLMIDSYGRFYDDSNGIHKYSSSILKKDVTTCLSQINNSFEKFAAREGNYTTIKLAA